MTDPGVAATGHPARIAEQIAGRGIDVDVYDRAHVEPTDESLEEAVEFARDAGPSTRSSRSAAARRSTPPRRSTCSLTNPGELMDYVNAPVGEGRAPEHPLLPLVAVPTTTGTGARAPRSASSTCSPSTVKTGISHPRLRPTLAVVDPALTLTQPAMVTAAAGMDILCHALECYTARWYADFDAKQPEQRVPYCGANPIADMWSEQALSLLAGAFRSAVRDGCDAAAREQMAMAATFAGLGFGNAGVHIPHANAYPIAGPGPRLPARGLPGGRADRPARHGGLADRAGGVPLHLRGRARAAPPRRPAARPRRPATARTRCPACCAAPDARHRHPQRPRRGRLRRRRRRRPGRRARCSSSGCWPPPRGR